MTVTEAVTVTVKFCHKAWYDSGLLGSMETTMFSYHGLYLEGH